MSVDASKAESSFPSALGAARAGRSLNELDRFAMLTREMMKPAFNRERIRGLDRMSLRIEHAQRLVQQVEPARISVGDQRACGLTLNRARWSGSCASAERAIEVFKGGEQISSKGRGVADRLFEHELFIFQTERLGAFKRATVGGHRFVESKDFFRLRRCLLRVIEPALIIAGLNVMMRERLNGDAASARDDVRALPRCADADAGGESDSTLRKALRESCRE